MSALRIFLFFFLLYHYGLPASSHKIKKSKTIATKLGNVHGIQEVHTDFMGRAATVYKFLGIPYAEKPTKGLRFRRPRASSNSKTSLDNYNATYYRPVCLQYVNGNPYLESIKLAWPGFDPSKNMDEDCLYLNIYTPRTKESGRCPPRKYPVMVYIHGGNFVAGTPIRDVTPGEYLPRHGIVLVTIQYRLGAFGFFTTGGPDAPGNLGILDQLEALKWIQKNIDDYCGEGGSVTLLGEGSGGSSVSMHVLTSLQSAARFHRVIALGGVALSPFAIKPKHTVLKASKILIQGLGCERQTSALTVQCLRNKTGSEIINSNVDLFNLQPYVDDHYLIDEPRKLFEEGAFNELPIIAGFASNEGANELKERPNIRNIAEFKSYLDHQFFQKYLNFTKEQAPNAFDALAFEYTPWNGLNDPIAYENNIINMLSDYTVIAPTHEVLSSLYRHNSNTYMFEFAYRSSNPIRPRWKGVIHEDALAYIFGLPLLLLPVPKTSLKFDVYDKIVSHKMADLLTHFAKFDYPGFAVNSKDIPWFPYSNLLGKAYMKFDKNLEYGRLFHSRRMAFWNNYFPMQFPCRERKIWYGQCKRNKKYMPSRPHSERAMW